MLANLHRLFWLSLIPFTTSWVGDHHAAALPTALYGSALFLAAVAYSLLVRALMAANRDEAALREAIGRDRKGFVSLAGYALGIGLAFVQPGAADAIFAAVAVIWLAPIAASNATSKREKNGAARAPDPTRAVVRYSISYRYAR